MVHYSEKHRLMSFNGTWENLDKDKKGFVFDYCNSSIFFLFIK
jgi:hypothetical protein